jgi:membrane-associated protein
LESFLMMLAGLDSWLVCLLLALLVFGESAALLAVFLPGELALLLAGGYVGLGHVAFEIVVAVALVAAIAGQAAGYELGRRYGLKVLRWRPLRRYAPALERASSLVTRFGPLAVLLGRWLNVTRVVVPLLVGAGRMPYRGFALCNVLGAMAWVLSFVTLGAFAGASLDAIEGAVGRASWVLLALVALAPVTTWLWRRLRRKRSARETDVDSAVGQTAQQVQDGSRRPAVRA